jgi:hypothetical protein
MTDGFLLAEDIARSILARTKCVWSQKPGDLCEPQHHAWRRLFSEDQPPVPLWFGWTMWEGRELVLQLHPRGRCLVVDPHQGASIRVWQGQAEGVGNRAHALAAHNPLVARTQRFQIRAIGSTSADVHHGRVAGAVQSFLDQK